MWAMCSSSSPHPTHTLPPPHALHSHTTCCCPSEVRHSNFTPYPTLNAPSSLRYDTVPVDDESQCPGLGSSTLHTIPNTFLNS